MDNPGGGQPTVSFRLDEDELERLDAMAELLEMPRSALLRLGVRAVIGGHSVPVRQSPSEAASELRTATDAGVRRVLEMMPWWHEVEE